jgi:hypothetical protein
MKSATDCEAEKKYSEALTSLQQARTFATSQALKSIDEKITALKIKQGQGSLFDMEDVVQPQQAQQPTQGNTAGQNGQQQSVNGQPMQQPVNGSAMQNGQPVYSQQTPVYENGQPVYHQPAYGQPQSGQQYYNNQPYNGQETTDVFPDPAPQPVMTTDYSAHREGDGYR